MHMRPRLAPIPLVSLLAGALALTLVLSGCGNPLAASPPPATATPIPPTATPSPALPTATPGPSATPTIPPTPTPIPIDATARPVAFPDAQQGGSGGWTVTVDVRARRVTAYNGGVVRIVDASSGRVTGPITATTSSDSALFAVDKAHQRAAVLVSSAYGGSAPTLSTVDLVAGHLLSQRALSRAPQTGARALVDDPAQGGLLAAFAGTVGAFSGGTPAQLVRLSPDGAVQRTRAISDYPALYLDAPHGIAVTVSPLSGSDTALAAYDARTLAPLWQGAAPYQPQAVTLDPAHRRLWLLAEGGRVTIMDTKTGRTVATCDPTYQKPAQWAGNKDLVVDPRTGVGYASEHAGTDYSTESDWIDRIDPATGRRTTLTPTGGAVVAVLDRTGRLLTLDDQNDLVLRDPVTGRVLAMVASNATLKGTSTGSFSASDASNLSVAQAGAAVTVAFATNIPYQNSVTGSADTPGLVLVSFQDRL